MFDLLCAVRGWVNTVPQAASSCPGFDRVINRGHSWETVQVKGVGNKEGDKRGKLCLKRSYSGPYNEGDFDLLAVVDVANGDAWLVPFDVVKEKQWWCPEQEWREYSTHVLMEG